MIFATNYHVIVIFRENKESKFNGKPPSKFNNEDGKEIDIKYIEVSKSDF